MADEAQVSILRKGVETWNEWRKTHPEIEPDLRQVDLHEAELRNANLREARLGRADLRGANLQLAIFSKADLSSANLSKTNLSMADLNEAKLSATWISGANLYMADLSGAYLGGAHLESATLAGAKFFEVDLSRAFLADADFAHSFMDDTRLGNVDLSRCKGLEQITHYGPSTIGIDTIYRSGGNIPEVFLRGAGVPEDFITYMRSLVGKPIEFYSCFISYSSKDHEFAERLHADLQGKKVRCWFAPEDLKIGDKFRTRIEESIRIYDKLMVVLSENSIQSPWVEEEVEAALEKERQQSKLVLFPIRLDDAVMGTKQAWAASLRRTRHIGEFSNWKNHDEYKKAFERLLRDLKDESAKAAVPRD